MYHDHTTLREWEERFDERFIPNDGGIPTYIENGNDLKEFIHQELQKAREEERERIKALFPKLNPNSDSFGTTEMERILKEIDQLIPIEMPVKGTQLDCKEHGVNQIVIKDGAGWCPECLSAEVLSK